MKLIYESFFLLLALHGIFSRSYHKLIIFITFIFIPTVLIIINGLGLYPNTIGFWFAIINVGFFLSNNYDSLVQIIIRSSFFQLDFRFFRLFLSCFVGWSVICISWYQIKILKLCVIYLSLNSVLFVLGFGFQFYLIS